MKLLNLKHGDRITDEFVIQLRAWLSKPLEDTEGCKLILSTTGGKTAAGFEAESILTNNVKVLHTTAYQAVTSIGILVFSAGQDRSCLVDAKFCFHPVQVGDESSGDWISLPELKKILADGLEGCGHRIVTACKNLKFINDMGLLDADELNKRITSLDLDTKRIAQTIAKNTKIEPDRILKAMADSEKWCASKAMRLGLVNKIVDEIDLGQGGELNYVLDVPT